MVCETSGGGGGRGAATYTVLKRRFCRVAGYPLSLQLRKYGQRYRVTLMVTETFQKNENVNFFTSNFNSNSHKYAIQENIQEN